ncbi:MAG: HPr family phosphocarrier protein [Lachnospiraceae bacterium]|nr:HPr family phosphocarrier protein [Lachnospiraceae bacterium]
MFTKSVIVNLPTDSEARPVAVMVQISSKFDSRVFVSTHNKKVNAKSIMGMMSIGFANGDELNIEAEGQDEEEAVLAMAKYIESK